jgi:hypothetical protein
LFFQNCGEVKTLNAGKAYLKTPNEHRAAVKERARKIPQQYLKKAKDADIKYNNGNPCVEHELRRYGKIQSFVFGSFATGAAMWTYFWKQYVQ